MDFISIWLLNFSWAFVNGLTTPLVGIFKNRIYLVCVGFSGNRFHHLAKALEFIMRSARTG